MIIYDNPPQAESHKPFYRKKKPTPISVGPSDGEKHHSLVPWICASPMDRRIFDWGSFFFVVLFFFWGGGGGLFLHREKSLCSFSATGLVVVTCFSLVVFWSQKMHTWTWSNHLRRLESCFFSSIYFFILEPSIEIFLREQLDEEPRWSESLCLMNSWMVVSKKITTHPYSTPHAILLANYERNPIIACW